jgi:putative MATE family efflux protein
MFSDKELRDLIVPVFVEQFLLMLVGIADTVVVSFASEAAVSGVSLVNSFNTVLVFLFTALSAGGAVIISQYIGRGDKREAGIAASQLLMVSLLISAALSVLILLFADPLLRLLFGKVEPAVMDACRVYLRILTCSLPALAVYDAGAALCRSIGRAEVTMYISLAANGINIIGNCIGVFALKLGAAGVAWPSLISRMLSAAAVTAFCLHTGWEVHYQAADIFTWNGAILKKIMCIALPNGVENGVHQLVKVALSSMIALFGTYQIAANGVAQSIWSLASIMGLAMAPVYTTVIGQCMGARDIGSANFYFRKLNKITLVLSILWNATCICHATPLIIGHSAISPEAKSLVIWLVLINNIFNAFAISFCGFTRKRAAGPPAMSVLQCLCLLRLPLPQGCFSLLYCSVCGWDGEPSELPLA